MHMEIDSNSWVFKLIATMIITSSLGALASVIRPQIVMASDLKKVDEKVDMVQQEVIHIKEDINAVNTNIKMVVQMIVESRIDDLEERIRTLEATKLRRELTADESYRLSRYRDDLEKEKLKRKSGG